MGGREDFFKVKKKKLENRGHEEEKGHEREEYDKTSECTEAKKNKGNIGKRNRAKEGENTVLNMGKEKQQVYKTSEGARRGTCRQ